MKYEGFLDRELREITEDRYNELRRDKTYYMIREYANSEWIIRAMWDGKLSFYCNSEAQLEARKTPFMLVVIKNGRSDVQTIPYRDESGVVAGYEDFLVRRNLAKFVPMGGEYGHVRFLEIGNQLQNVDLRKVFDVAPNEALPELAGSW